MTILDTYYQSENRLLKRYSKRSVIMLQDILERYNDQVFRENAINVNKGVYDDLFQVYESVLRLHQKVMSNMLLEVKISKLESEVDYE